MGRQRAADDEFAVFLLLPLFGALDQRIQSLGLQQRRIFIRVGGRLRPFLDDVEGLEKGFRAFCRLLARRLGLDGADPLDGRGEQLVVPFEHQQLGRVVDHLQRRHPLIVQVVAEQPPGRAPGRESVEIDELGAQRRILDRVELDHPVVAVDAFLEDDLVFAGALVFGDHAHAVVVGRLQQLLGDLQRRRACPVGGIVDPPLAFADEHFVGLAGESLRHVSLKHPR